MKKFLHSCWVKHHALVLYLDTPWGASRNCKSIGAWPPRLCLWGFGLPTIRLMPRSAVGGHLYETAEEPLATLRPLVAVVVGPSIAAYQTRMVGSLVHRPCPCDTTVRQSRLATCLNKTACVPLLRAHTQKPRSLSHAPRKGGHQDRRQRLLLWTAHQASGRGLPVYACGALASPHRAEAVAPSGRAWGIGLPTWRSPVCPHRR